MAGRFRSAVVAAAVLGALVGLAPAASAVTASWSIETLPPPLTKTTGSLTSVSCGTPSACVAVGFYTARDGHEAPFANVGAGQTWHASLPPDPGGGAASLTAVSCPAARLCLASGGVGASGFVERWNGSRWALLPDALDQPLSDISCASTTFCIAIGARGQTGSYASESWDGTGWHVLPAWPRADAVRQVSCATATFCMALGTSPSRRYGPVTYVWDGAQWTDVTSSGFRSGFNDIDCRFGSCTLVGGGQRGIEIAAYRSGGWVATRVPADTAGVSLRAVSCASANSCLALGGKFDGSPPRAFASSGLSWADASGPDVLGGLDCHFVDACVVATSTNAGPVLRVRQGSTWVDGGAAGVTTTADSELSGVSCVGGWCAVVGTYLTPDGMEHEYATESTSGGWQTQTLPSTRVQRSLSSISCVSTSFCVATGIDSQGAEGWRWDGTTWTNTLISAGRVSITGLSCASTTFCMAVGSEYTGSSFLPVVRVFDGQGWSTAPTPPLDNVQGLSCLRSSFCVAAGNLSGRAFVATWRGAAWKRTPLPGLNLALDVSCASTSFCVAAGNDKHNELTLEHFDGTDWTPVAVPAMYVGRLSVSCGSVTRCVAMNGYNDAAAWDGASWTEAPPVPAGDETSLVATACNLTSCRAVGSANNRQLVEKLS